MGGRKPKRRSFAVSSFNVRGLNSNFRQDALRHDLKSYRVDLCFLQETKLTGSLDTEKDGYRLIALAPQCRHYGLLFLVSSSLSSQIQKYWSLSDRVAVLTINLPSREGNGGTKASTLAIINVYAPTSSLVARGADELDKFYSDLNSAKSSAIVLFAGDFNAKVGKKSDARETCCGRHGRGKRNLSGQSLIDFCHVNDLFICNTAFQHNTRHVTTWTGHRRDGASGATVPVYNQIGYMLCKSTQRRLLLDSRSYGRCTLSSDHRLVVARLDLQRLYGIFGQRKKDDLQAPKFNTFKLAERQVQEEYAEKLASELLAAHQVQGNTGLQERSRRLMEVVRSAAGDVLGTVQQKTRHKAPDHEIELLSLEQRSLRISIGSTNNPDTKVSLKTKRNRILHTIRTKCRDNAEKIMQERAAEVERLKNGARMFKAVQLMTRKPSRKPIVHDQKGRFIADDQEAASTVRGHFHDQFRGNVDAGVEPFIGRPRSPQRQISSAEVSNALKKLNNGRSPGPDGVPGELSKYGRENLAPHIACLFNSMFTTHQHLDLGCGTLVPLQKPGKTVGSPGDLHPIVLLTSLCKTLSIITLRRISSKVGEYLSPTQSGFRAGRSTADLVWSHRWFAATCQHYRREMTILGIDMSKAFDCIRRDKLLTVLESFLTEDDVRLVRVLLTNTTLQVRIGRAVSESLETTIGTPQGDSLSPVLFVIYLEAALRDLRST